MIPTLPYIERIFDEFNRLMFAGKLPRIPIVLTDAKTFLGKCVYKKKRNLFGRIVYYDFQLRINTRVDLPEQEVQDTLIHEMIHYFIGVNQLEDVSSHGPMFLHIMNTINEKFGRNITVSFKGTKEQQEQFVDKKQRYRVVAVVRFHDGRTGIKVLPRILQRILNYYNTISGMKDVKRVELYMSNNVFFNRYPNSSALKVHYIEESELSENLRGAESLICDGKKIKRIN